MSDREQIAQVAQRKWATVSESLRSLRGNERQWANRSGRSRQMSNPERFAQVTQRKWANERFAQNILAKKSKILFLVCFIYDIKKFYWKMSESFIFAHFLFFGERCERVAHNRSFSLIDVSESLRLLTKNEWCEWIAQVTNQKWATMSDSLTWLRGNERSRSNRSGRSPKMSDWGNRSFANFWQKTSNSHGKLMSEFPALTVCTESY